ncbi:MAG: 30S ribosomal protein S15 [Candidatus Micrarchaeota archaeon]|nr:30S ribosomal protein S15 [Candidatus Micrarchaeota archaeon]
MARMHSKRRGKSKSRKPLAESIGEPKEFDRAKIEETIVNYAKQGMEPARIGEMLKNEHGIPYVKHYMGKRLVRIMQDKGVAEEMPPDIMDLMKKAVKINSHMEKNRQDYHNQKKLNGVEAKIWRLTKYYIAKGKLPEGWRYDPKQAALLIKKTT